MREEFKLDLSELTLEEALEKGIITIGSWNKEEWDIQMPEWRRALELAEEYHEKAGSTYTDKTKELQGGTKKPYIGFIQELLRILINEVHLQNDDILTAAALYNIFKMTDCDRAFLVQEFGGKIVERVELLQTKEKETFGEQLKRLALMEENVPMVTYIFLAVKLLEERVTDRCPLGDWTEDIPYYKKMMEELQNYGLKYYREKNWKVAIFLSQKILEQLDKNMDLSRNCNKTAEELYAGWNDEKVWENDERFTK